MRDTFDVMTRDLVDRIIEQWGLAAPEMDVSPLSVVSRIIVLAEHLERRTDKALSEHGVSLWQLDILAALRRAGPPFTLTPTQLLGNVILSSGAMTNRIDRLEAGGFVSRKADPNDRRGVLITLTSRGRRIADEATQSRLAHARGLLTVFSKSEIRELASLLRKLLASVENGDGPG